MKPNNTLLLFTFLCALFVSACTTVPTPPKDLANIPDAVPRAEPLSRTANRPYTVMGVRYVPRTALAPFRQEGVASWYGPNFHGKKTSLGDVYDMYAMTAAHPTLPLPSYVRVTRLVGGRPTGRSVVVRVNDRGPFVGNRVIDLSYAAAHRLGMVAAGTAPVLVEAVFADGTSSLSAPVASPVPSIPPAPIASDQPLQPLANGFIVQLGVFALQGNAEAFLAHLKGRINSGNYPLQLAQRPDGNWRVFVGVYPTRADAERAAQSLDQTFGLKTFLTTQ